MHLAQTILLGSLLQMPKFLAKDQLWTCWVYSVLNHQHGTVDRPGCAVSVVSSANAPRLVVNIIKNIGIIRKLDATTPSEWRSCN